MKYKFLLILAVIFIYASSCEEDVPEVEPFDHATQAVKDNESLIEYFQTHFVNADGDLELMTADTTGETPLFENEDLKNEIVKYSLGGEEIDLTLYHLVLTEGTVNDTPARVDRAHVSYEGMDLDHEVFDRNEYGFWADLYSGVISGWSYGMLYFEPGTKEELSDETYEYSGGGTGYLFIPSGLAYQNTGELANKPLIFKVKLNDVFRTDHDKDGIYSKYEVEIDEEGNVGKYVDLDTDGDGTPNFIDNDDDGDGVLTEDENADPNEDGNPSDAIDSNNNEIPDYLDPSSN